MEEQDTGIAGKGGDRIRVVAPEVAEVPPEVVEPYARVQAQVPVLVERLDLALGKAADVEGFPAGTAEYVRAHRPD
jgi:hypothetical protein